MGIKAAATEVQWQTITRLRHYRPKELKVEKKSKASNKNNGLFLPWESVQNVTKNEPSMLAWYTTKADSFENEKFRWYVYKIQDIYASFNYI